MSDDIPDAGDISTPSSVDGDTLVEDFWIGQEELLRDTELGEIVVVTRRFQDVDDTGIHSRYYEIADWTLTHYEKVSGEEAQARYERTGRKRSHPKPSMNDWVREQMDEAGLIEERDA